MATEMVFQPIVPKLTVRKLETPEDIAEVEELLRVRRDVFVGLPSNFRYIHVQGLPDESPLNRVLDIGCYLVISENGCHFLTSSKVVKHGVFNDFPPELFIPWEGVRVS